MSSSRASAAANLIKRARAAPLRSSGSVRGAGPDRTHPEHVGATRREIGLLAPGPKLPRASRTRTRPPLSGPPRGVCTWDRRRRSLPLGVAAPEAVVTCFPATRDARSRRHESSGQPAGLSRRGFAGAALRSPRRECSVRPDAPDPETAKDPLWSPASEVQDIEAAARRTGVHRGALAAYPPGAPPPPDAQARSIKRGPPDAKQRLKQVKSDLYSPSLSALAALMKGPDCLEAAARVLPLSRCCLLFSGMMTNP